MSEVTLTHDCPGSISLDSANLNVPASQQQYSERRSETFPVVPGPLVHDVPYGRISTLC